MCSNALACEAFKKPAFGKESADVLARVKQAGNEFL